MIPNDLEMVADDAADRERLPVAQVCFANPKTISLPMIPLGSKNHE